MSHALRNSIWHQSAIISKGEKISTELLNTQFYKRVRPMASIQELNYKEMALQPPLAPTLSSLTATPLWSHYTHSLLLPRAQRLDSAK